MRAAQGQRLGFCLRVGSSHYFTDESMLCLDRSVWVRAILFACHAHEHRALMGVQEVTENWLGAVGIVAHGATHSG